MVEIKQDWQSLERDKSISDDLFESAEADDGTANLHHHVKSAEIGPSHHAAIVSAFLFTLRYFEMQQIAAVGHYQLRTILVCVPQLPLVNLFLRSDRQQFLRLVLLNKICVICIPLHHIA